jgi:hypothetical protein
MFMISSCGGDYRGSGKEIPDMDVKVLAGVERQEYS